MILCYVATIREETWFVSYRALAWFALAFWAAPLYGTLGVYGHWWGSAGAPYSRAGVGPAAVAPYHEVFALARCAAGIEKLLDPFLVKPYMRSDEDGPR